MIAQHAFRIMLIATCFPKGKNGKGLVSSSFLPKNDNLQFSLFPHHESPELPSEFCPKKRKFSIFCVVMTPGHFQKGALGEIWVNSRIRLAKMARAFCRKMKDFFRFLIMIVSTCPRNYVDPHLFPKRGTVRQICGKIRKSPLFGKMARFF